MLQTSDVVAFVGSAPGGNVLSLTQFTKLASLSG